MSERYKEAQVADTNKICVDTLDSNERIIEFLDSGAKKLFWTAEIEKTCPCAMSNRYEFTVYEKQYSEKIPL